MNTIKTKIHAYWFDIRKTEDQNAYLLLVERLKAQGLKVFETHGGKGHYHFVKPIDGKEIELETEHLFNNQWNTAPIGDSESGLRVFDWAQDYPINFDKAIKRGHYLEQTPEMAEVRRNTVACGYCGFQTTAQRGYVFCPQCIGSEYLKASELNLTRMRAVDDESPRMPLTKAESEHLMPLYKEAQLHGNTERDKKRIAKQRADIEKKYRAATSHAKNEHDGLLWLMDRGIKIDNVIYYSHTDRFSFGWRSPVAKEIESAILDVISEFPFNYEIKTEDGRTLSNC